LLESADEVWARPGDFEVVVVAVPNRVHVPLARAAIEAGIAVQYSCCDGVCGTCETRVLEGVPDHRDSVLLGEDANATDRMMVCVSRCTGAALTLDL